MLNLDQLKAKGIVVEGAKGVMAYDTVNGKIKTNFSKTALAMDSALQTTPNVAYPASFFQYIDPQIVEILFGVTNANKIAPEVKQGTWADEFYTYTTEEAIGDVTAYSDRTENVTSEVNYEFQTREQARFETILQYGNLEVDKASQAKIALASRKQIAGANIIARKQNQFYLYGVSGKINYGLLNDPNLNASINPNTITIGGNTYTTWADKTANDAQNAGNHVFNDVLKLWSELSSKNGGNIDQNERIILAVSNNVVSYLSAPNAFGLTAMAMIKDNFPNLEVVQLPELSTQAGEQIKMIVPSLYGVDTVNLVYSDKFRAMQVVQTVSGYKQKLVSTSYGAVVKRSSLIATMNGV
jgi:hypothetical protein